MEETELHAAQSIAEKNPQDTREVDPLTDNDEPTFERRVSMLNSVLPYVFLLAKSIYHKDNIHLTFPTCLLGGYCSSEVEVWILVFATWTIWTTSGKHYHLLHAKRSRIQMVLYEFRILLILLNTFHSAQFVTIITVSSPCRNISKRSLFLGFCITI